MKTPAPTSGNPPAPAASARPGTATPPRWQIGQVLRASVRQGGSGEVLLDIGRQILRANTPVALETGQQLELQVRALGRVPLLRIAATGADPLTQARRNLLPVQDSLAPLLASLARLAADPRPAVPPLLQARIRQLLQNLPQAQALTRSEGLREALKGSGLWLEQHLAQGVRPQQPGPEAVVPETTRPGAPPTGPDFKVDLLRLIRHLSQLNAGTGPATATRDSPSPSLPASGATRTPAVATTASTGPAGGSPVGTARPAPGEISGPTNPREPVSERRQTGDGPPASRGQPATARELAATARAASRVATSLSGPGPAASPATPGPATPTAGTAARVLPPPLPGTVPQAQAVPKDAAAGKAAGILVTELLRQAEAALARLQLHQLASQPRDADRSLLEWMFDLPVRRGSDIDLWSLRLIRERETEHDEHKPARHRWSVELAFDLPGLGPVQARVQLLGAQVSTRFWVERPPARALFRQHLDTLRDLFDEAGLKVGQLDCEAAPMPEGEGPHAPPLIEEKA